MITTFMLFNMVMLFFGASAIGDSAKKEKEGSGYRAFCGLLITAMLIDFLVSFGTIVWVNKP